MSVETRVIRQRRILVVRCTGFRASAAWNMARAGWTAGRIAAALRASPARVAKALAVAPDGSIWGALAPVLADEMRRAT